MPQEKILVVDDEPTIVELCTRFLTKEGYLVKTASNGQEALKIFREEPIDMLLTDIRMKGMSGLELIDAAKKRDEGIAIVVITGHGTVNMAIESLKLGTLGFVIKPFTMDELLTAVRHATEKNRLIKENIRLRSLMPLFEINRRLVTTDPDHLFNQIVESARVETKADRASLMLLDETGRELQVKAHSGFSIVIPSKMTKKIGEGVAGVVAQTRKPLIIQGGVQQNPELASVLEGGELVSSVSVPLIGKGHIKISSLTRPPQMHEQLIGVLNISKSSPGAAPFTESDLELVSLLAGQASAAIENATLFYELHQSYVKTIRSLVATMELKDSYTSGHSENVSRYAAALAREMELSTTEIDEIEIGGILHDIGKIGSSEDILLKEGRLTEKEFELMKAHPKNAVKILNPVGLSGNILKIVLHHHEQCNGKGYPDGLSREQIPLGSRILMVADTIDAMTSDRPYRKAQSITKLAGELRKYTGPQFDPDVVGAFERLMGKVGPDFFRHQ
ncbi:MAG: response regulator [Nitrospirae bacterium]|nr:response regulator [Nitrospirota bacterium]